MSRSMPGSETEIDVPGAQAVLRGLDLLLAIGAAPRPPRFSDLEKELGIPRATLHRLLTALVSRRLARYDERTRTYHTGSRVLELSRRSLDQSETIRAAKPELARIARKLQRTVCVMMLDDQAVFVLDFEDAEPAYGRMVRLWPRLQAVDCAGGRALLAAMPKDRCEAFLSVTAPPAGSSTDRLRAEISVATALGYAVMTREPGSGRAGAAAAILDSSGYPIGAITCLFETDDVAAEHLHEVGRTLAEGARRASGHMGMMLATPAVQPRPAARGGDSVEVLPVARDFVGENPVWNPLRRRVYWVDVLGPALRWYEPESRRSARIELQQMTAGIAFDRQDRLIGSGEQGLSIVDPESGSVRRLINPEADNPDNRCNTVGIDHAGRLWTGSMAINHEPDRGSLYAIDGDLTIHRRVDKVGRAKNIAFDSAGRLLYFADTGANVVHAFDLDIETGSLANKRVLIDFDTLPGQPNGITVDADDHIWVACHGGWRVCRFDPSGALVREILLPVPMPTNCAFGGENLDTLFVTSNWIRLPPGLSAEAPGSGQLIAIDAGVRGQPLRRFGEGAA